MLDFTGTKVTDSARRGCWREAECDGKTPYASKAEAIRRIKCQEKSRGFKRKGGLSKLVALVPYRCPHCHCWHVGGTDKSRLRRKPKCNH